MIQRFHVAEAKGRYIQVWTDGPAALSTPDLIALVARCRPERAQALWTDNRQDATRLPHVAVTDPVTARLAAAVELGRRTLMLAASPAPCFTLPREIAAYLLPRFGAHPVERFGTVLLDAKHRLLRTTLITSGSVDNTSAHPREVFADAIAARASALVLFHNHPSGDPSPSPDDLTLTTRLCHASAILGITVLDHLILADTRYHSFRESGQLPKEYA